jgi:hypothetical protein
LTLVLMISSSSSLHFEAPLAARAGSWQCGTAA